MKPLVLKKLSAVSESIDYGLTASATNGSGPRFLRITDLKDGDVDWSAVPGCDMTISDGARFCLRDGDIVFARTGATTGKSHLISNPPAGAVFASYLIRVRVNDELSPRFLAHYFRSSSYWKQVAALSEGAAQPGVNATKLGSIKVPVPSLVEQVRIAAILDKADSIRRKRQDAVRLADDFVRALFVEMFGDPITNPKGWNSDCLGDVCTKIGSGATPKGGEAAYKVEGIALIRSMNVRDGDFLWKDLARIDDEQADRLSNVIVQADDVLINITGASVARVCRTPVSVVPARVNQHVSILRPTSKLLPAFLEQLLLTSAVKSQLLNVGEAGATRQAITKSELEGFKIIVPPIKAQAAFCRIQSKVSDLVAKASESTEASETMRASLGNQFFDVVEL